VTETTAQTRMTASDLRVSDADRDGVAAELAEHLTNGRLQVAEFDERVGQAINARTRGDLDRLLTDLPRPTPQRPASRRRTGPPFPMAAILIFVAVMATIGGISRTAGGGHPIWLLWWLIPVAIFATRRRLRGHRPQEQR